MNLSSQGQKNATVGELAGSGGSDITGAILMQSIHLFNDDQIKDFKMICSDLCGPTMTEYVLGVMARAIAALECDPEIDPSAFHDEVLRNEVLVCLAALDYADVKRVLESK